jgi:formamidopyrimidine-DNA glycosylase
VGNIYANDALFIAGISPARPAHSLTEAEVARVLKGLEQVLEEGLRLRGASDNTYVDLYGKKGGYQNKIKVYKKRGEDCPNSCGGTIEYCKINGRGTFFCKNCQN